MAKNDPEREKRLAEQLRANLRRRKVQGWKDSPADDIDAPKTDKAD